MPRAWPLIQAGQSVLLAAPTGSGKTLSAFLAVLDALLRQGLEQGGTLHATTQIVYVSPLKALSNDIRLNLQVPLEGIQRALQAQGHAAPTITTAVRTGDTPQKERIAMRKQAPHILVTTPESLYVLMGSASGREGLRTVHTVIVDEIHALAGNKRGCHLALTLERLQALCDRPLRRIGLSATQRPVERVAQFLVGSGRACAIVDVGHARQRDLAIEIPPVPLGAVLDQDAWGLVYDRLAELARAHRTTLVFVNTRRLAERITRHLSDRLGAAAVAAHHGSLSKERRLSAEQRLKAGELQVLVATASLELGIDIGDIDLVCQVASPGSIAAFLQRVGRAGHQVDGVPKGRLFATSRDDLIECVALLDCVRRGELDEVQVPQAPLDVLAQQIVAEASNQRLQRPPGRARRVPAPRCGQRHGARAPWQPAHRFDQWRDDSRQCRLRRHARPPGAEHRQRQRRLRRGEHGWRHLPAGQCVLSHPARGGRASPGRRRTRPAPHDPVLARRSPWAQPRAQRCRGQAARADR